MRMPITGRRHVENYRIRSVVGGYPGDVIESHSRIIGGKQYYFIRVRWADGSVTVRAHRWNSSAPAHCWTSRKGN